MNKTLREQLIEKGFVENKKSEKRTNKIKSGTKSKENGTKSKKIEKIERFSERELADLMGTRRPTYGRGKGGAYRQR